MSNSLYGVVHKMLQPVLIVLIYVSVSLWLSHRVLAAVVLGLLTLSIHALSEACQNQYERWKSYIRDANKESV